MNRAALIATTLFAFGTAGAATDDPVRLDTGMISGACPDVAHSRVFLLRPRPLAVRQIHSFLKAHRPA
jgi:hypothetical protein